MKSKYLSAGMTTSDGNSRLNFVPDLPAGPITAYILRGDFDFAAPILRPGHLRSSEILFTSILTDAHADRARSVLAAAETFGGDGDRCFIPRFGFTVGSEDSNVDILVCIECYRVYFFSADIHSVHCLTEVGRIRLISLHNKLFPGHDPEPRLHNK